jgi:hypothetical protein
MTTSICQVQKRTFTPPSTHCHNRHQNHKLYQPPWETHQQSQNSLEEQSDIKYLGSRYPFGDDELSAVLLFPSPGGAGAKDGCRSSLTGLWNLMCMQQPPVGTDLRDSQANFEAMKQERFVLMQVIETKILP